MTLFPKFSFVFCIALSVVLPFDCAYARKVEGVHSFTGADGAQPSGGIILDKAGNIYGTTMQGGLYNMGTVYKIGPDGTQTVLHSFAGGTDDGADPQRRLTLDEAGNLYGAARAGIDNPDCGQYGCGMIFRIAPDGMESAIHNFNGKDGAYPAGSLIWDKAGNLIGAASQGGGHGFGVIFRLAPDGTYTVLHEFKLDKNDGVFPNTVIADKAGNLYGTTSDGGAGGGGIVFKLAPNGRETILHSFVELTQGYTTDGYWPSSDLIMDKAGNLYGTTWQGGVGTQFGVVYKVAQDGTETVLHSFGIEFKEGTHPIGNLFLSKQGNLYGTTYAGGRQVENYCPGGCGVIFEITPANTFEVIHKFSNGDDGATPVSLIADKANNFLGTAVGGGDSFVGTVFKLKR